MSALTTMRPRPTEPAISTFTFSPNDTLSMSLRAIMIDGEPWFSAKNVCEALGYANVSQSLTDHVDHEDKRIVSIGSAGRAPWAINESGLYSLILRSHKPEAKMFKRWITKEVLPAIRKHGAYVHGANGLSQDEQEALYATIRALLAEALRRYDRETEHAHYRSLPKQREWFRLSAEKVSREMALPLSVVLAAATGGVDAGMSVIARAT
jgi:prophage antirepressor-like protein